MAAISSYTVMCVAFSVKTPLVPLPTVSNYWTNTK